MFMCVIGGGYIAVPFADTASRVHQWCWYCKCSTNCYRERWKWSVLVV